MTEEFFGIPDEAFQRADVPMTKAEIRWIVAASLRLFPGARLLDVGAGTGSVSIECARLAGEVVALEREPDALELIRANVERFGVNNVAVVSGEAPAALSALGRFDRVFIGGSGNSLEDIIAVLPSMLSSGGRVVVTAILLETLEEALRAFTRAPWHPPEVSQVSVARRKQLGKSKHMFSPLTPVWVVSATLGGDS